MQQKKLEKNINRNVRKVRHNYMLAAGALATWICIALCLVQLVRIHAQLEEQSEQISRTYDMIRQLRAESGEQARQETQDGGDVQESGYSMASLGHSAAETEVVSTLSLSYAEQCALDYVDKPQDRNHRQVLKKLEELGELDERIAAIRQNSEAYPERLLEALANNPEMADFVEGWLTVEHVAEGGLTDSEKEEAFPIFLQWDPRWGYASYGSNSCIAVSGCGPTCLSMVLYYLTGDENLTPDLIGDFSMENGYYLPGTGTLWALMEDVAPLYGVKVSQPDASEDEMKAALDQGSVLICSMKPGDFTAGGHFIVVYGYDQDGFMVNDPNCVARSRVRWTFDQLDRQMKHLWVFEK